MSEKADDQKRSKPDGSAYAAHLAGIAERNVASKKAGRARREAHERSQGEARRAAERLQDAGLRKKGGGQ
jgi:hypothetical protein